MPGALEQPASRGGGADGARAGGRAAFAFGPASLAGSWLLAKAYMARQRSPCTACASAGPDSQGTTAAQVGGQGAAL